MNESRLRDKVKKYLESKEGWYKKVHQGYYSGGGLPDFIGSLKGRFMAIELKRDSKGKLSTLQAITIKEIKEKGGGISFVAYGWEDFRKKFDYIYEKLLKGEV